MSQDLVVAHEVPVACEPEAKRRPEEANDPPAVVLKGLGQSIWYLLAAGRDLDKTPDSSGQSTLLFKDANSRVVDIRIRREDGYKDHLDNVDLLIQRGSVVFVPQYATSVLFTRCLARNSRFIHVDMTAEFMRSDVPIVLSNERTGICDALMVLAGAYAQREIQRMGLKTKDVKHVFITSRHVPKVAPPQDSSNAEESWGFIDQVPLVTLISQNKIDLSLFAKEYDIEPDRMRALAAYRIVNVSRGKWDIMADEVISATQKRRRDIESLRSGSSSSNNQP